MKKFTLFLFCFSFLSASFFKVQSQQNNPAVIFYTGFEEGNKDIWDDWDGNPDTENKIISDPGPFNDPGNHVIKLFVPPGQGGGSDLVKVLPSQHDSLYVQWYIKYEAGFNLNARNHGSGLWAGSRNHIGSSDNRPMGNDFASFQLEHCPDLHIFYIYSYSRGMYMDCRNPRGACWGDAFPCTADSGKVYCTKVQHRPPPMPPVVETGKWYRFDMFVYMGTPSSDGSVRDGVLAFWIDGVPYGRWTDLWLRTSSELKLANLWMSLYHHDGSHSVEGVLYDEIRISKDASLLTGISDKVPSSNLINIYPNPAEKLINITVSENDSYLASIYNMEGKLILSKNISSNENIINIEALNKGLYHIVLNDLSNNIFVGSQKFICK